jgi:NADH-quinone oxidoreductase subunit H
VATTVYLGGWYFPYVHELTETKGYHALYVVLSIIIFVTKLLILLYVYFWLRWTLPRYRYDQLMDLGWKWLIPAALTNIVWSSLAIFVVQALDGWRGYRTVESLAHGLNLTGTGKFIMIALGFLGLFVTAGVLSSINWRSRDFNLKSQRRNIRLMDLPKGKPAVAAPPAG